MRNDCTRLSLRRTSRFGTVTHGAHTGCVLSIIYRPSSSHQLCSQAESLYVPALALCSAVCSPLTPYRAFWRSTALVIVTRYAVSSFPAIHKRHEGGFPSAFLCKWHLYAHVGCEPLRRKELGSASGFGGTLRRARVAQQSSWG